ncbi:hypothetical protein HD554DRAFT_2035109 [Boletus coccyginus]|nr:hypothetical protein HD554DRAFT_2035109 [Boletus coccyginus]
MTTTFAKAFRPAVADVMAQGALGILAALEVAGLTTYSASLGGARRFSQGSKDKGGRGHGPRVEELLFHIKMSMGHKWHVWVTGKAAYDRISHLVMDMQMFLGMISTGFPFQEKFHLKGAVSVHDGNDCLIVGIPEHSTKGIHCLTGTTDNPQDVGPFVGTTIQCGSYNFDGIAGTKLNLTDCQGWGHRQDSGLGGLEGGDIMWEMGMDVGVNVEACVNWARNKYNGNGNE